MALLTSASIAPQLIIKVLSRKLYDVAYDGDVDEVCRLIFQGADPSWAPPATGDARGRRGASTAGRCSRKRRRRHNGPRHKRPFATNGTSLKGNMGPK